jgi:hypothetical protein
LLGEPTIAPGAIIPNPLDDPLDFLVTEGSGIADATFSTFGTESSDHILSNGVFFAFDVEALSPGIGTLAFDFASATEFNPANPSEPIELMVGTGPALDFTVVVPEPSTAALLLCAVSCGAAAVWRRACHRVQ